MNIVNRPLITIALFAYNQQRFIREAFESVLAQIYSPLEVIVLDDCSMDRSFEVIQEMAAAYRGPHSVHVFRNPTNLGIGGSVSRVMELCRGEFVVLAAGDDISMSNRTEVIYQAWEESGRRAKSIFSSHINISADGAEQGIGGIRGDLGDSRVCRPLDGELFQFLSTRNPMVNGCTAAWSKELIEYFGPVRADLEDVVLSFRTLAIGQLLYIHQPLVKYRRHGDNVSFYPGEDLNSFEHREKRLRWGNETTAKTYDNLIDDIEVLCVKGRISKDERDRLQAEARRIQKPYRLERQMMDGSMGERLLALATVVRSGDLRGAVHIAPRALPRSLYRALYLLREKANAAFRGRRPSVSVTESR
jgi:glycosyltransferase involved in cell wall biosynthesis